MVKICKKKMPVPLNPLKKLAELYKSASGRFKSAAQEMKADKPEDKVLNDVLAYNNFFSRSAQI
ncbi:MAG: hypothetical protein SCARUB_03621 [Candidatus Scalindua rubra]|uniref:Uncharacterized protein n=1 Tax=Candidatus Scalindua rubra TaxID=1872076 RepID=A0A1E3X6N2_9BACT|nr:MAG: hypothetical protein SCARUB_03621 [Candidatus Scalindua rubra]